MKKANREGWKGLKVETDSKVTAEVQQKTAAAAADNATLASDIRRRLLERLKRIESKYPLDATEVRQKHGDAQAVFRIRDLTAAYKDLTGDMPAAQAPNELLQSLMDLERRAQ